MIYKPYQLPKSNDTAIMPLIFSVVVHLLVVGVIVFWQAPEPKPEVAGIETTFFGQADLEAVEGAIRENARLAQQGDDGTDETNAKTPSPETLAINEELARKQAEFEKQMAEFAAELDKVAQAEQRAYQDNLNEEARLEQEALAQAREAFANQDEKVRENQKALDEARAMRDKAIAEDEAKKRKQGGKSGSLASPDPTSNESGNAGTNKASLQSAVAEHIKRYWQPIGEKGTRLTTQIRVDAAGNVLSVRVAGGTEAQRQSLETAIKNASPITPIVGTEFRTFSPFFVVQ